MQVGAEPEHAPPQFKNTESLSGVAVRVTSDPPSVPDRVARLHVGPHESVPPATVPEPSYDFSSESVGPLEPPTPCASSLPPPQPIAAHSDAVASARTKQADRPMSVSRYHGIDGTLVPRLGKRRGYLGVDNIRPTVQHPNQVTVRLLALSGPRAGTQYSLEAPIRIGSSPECELCIPDSKIAPLHATIRSDERHRGLVIEAHALLHVDATAVRRMELACMSEIDIGDSTLLFQGGTAFIMAPGHVEPWPGAPPLMAHSTLVRVAPLEMARAKPALVGLDAHRLLVVGGLSPLGNTPVDSAELVDIRSGERRLIPLCEARQHPVALRLRDGRVFIAGGTSGAEMLTPAGAVPCKASARVARQGAYAAELPDGRVLIVGGYPSSASMPSMELYDPRRDVFETLEAPELPFARVAQAGPMLLICASRPLPSRLFSFDLRTLELLQLPTPLPDGFIDAVAGLADGRFWVRAGSNDVQRASFVFDPTTAVLRSAAPNLAARSDFVAALSEDGRLLVAGGSSREKGHNSAELYDPARDAWEALPTLRMGIGSTAVAVSLPQGPVVIVDGDQLLTFDVHWAARAPQPVFPQPRELVEPLDRFKSGAARRYAQVLDNFEMRETLGKRSESEFPTTPITDAEVVEVLALGLKARTLRAALKCAETLAHAKALPELAIPPLLDALAHPSENLRRSAVLSLSELAPLPDAAVSAVIARLRTESQSWVRATMVALLARHVSQRSGLAHQVLTSVLTHLAHGEPDPVLTAAKSGWSFAAHGRGAQPERHEAHIREVAEALATLPAHPLDFPYLVPLLGAHNLFVRKSAEALLEQLAGVPSLREDIIECLRPLVVRRDEGDYGRVARLATILDKLGDKELLTQVAESIEDDSTVIHVLKLLAARDDDDDGTIAQGLDRLQAKYPAHTQVGSTVRAARSRRGLPVDDGRAGAPLAQHLALYSPLELPLTSDLLISHGLVFAGVMQSELLRRGLSLSEACCGVVVIDPERELACRTFRLPLRFPAGNTGARGARREWQIAAVTGDGLLMMMDQPFSRDGGWGKEQYLYEWLLKEHSWRRWRRVSGAWHKEELSPTETEETPTNRVSVGELRVWQEAPGGEVFAHVDSTPTFLEDAVSPDGTMEAVRAEADFRGKTFASGRRTTGALAWDIDGLPPLLDPEAAVRAHERRAEPDAKLIMLTSLSYRTPSGTFVRLVFCRSGRAYDGVGLLR